MFRMIHRVHVQELETTVDEMIEDGAARSRAEALHKLTDSSARMCAQAMVLASSQGTMYYRSPLMWAEMSELAALVGAAELKYGTPAPRDRP